MDQTRNVQQTKTYEIHCPAPLFPPQKMLPVFTPLAKTSTSSRTTTWCDFGLTELQALQRQALGSSLGVVTPRPTWIREMFFGNDEKVYGNFGNGHLKKMVRVMKVDGNQGIYNSFALNIGETPWEFHSKIRCCPPRRSSVGPSLGMLCGSDKKPSTKIPSWNFVGKNLRFLSVEIGT